MPGNGHFAIAKLGALHRSFKGNDVKIVCQRVLAIQHKRIVLR